MPFPGHQRREGGQCHLTAAIRKNIYKCTSRGNNRKVRGKQKIAGKKGHNSNFAGQGEKIKGGIFVERGFSGREEPYYDCLKGGMMTNRGKLKIERKKGQNSKSRNREGK